MQYDKIVFLDVDGVLNDGQYIKDLHAVGRCERASGGITRSKVIKGDLRKHMLKQINPDYVKNLNEILNKFNLGIILSSSWRNGSFSRDALFEVGIDKYAERLLGYTDSIAACRRGGEIKHWIKENNFKGKFIILDDDADMESLMAHLFQTSWYGGGLNEENKNKCISFCERIFSLDKLTVF